VANIVKILLPNFPRALPNDLLEKVRQLDRYQHYVDGVLWKYQVEEIRVDTISAQSQLLALVKAKDTNEQSVPYFQVIIVSLFEKEHPDLLERLHLASRNLTVLGITPDKGNMYVEQLCPKRRPIPNDSMQNVEAVMREVLWKPCS